MTLLTNFAIEGYRFKGAVLAQPAMPLSNVLLERFETVAWQGQNVLLLDEWRAARSVLKNRNEPWALARLDPQHFSASLRQQSSRVHPSTCSPIAVWGKWEKGVNVEITYRRFYSLLPEAPLCKDGGRYILQSPHPRVQSNSHSVMAITIDSESRDGQEGL
jgi:hypothetical protein